jgi:hypothetical protein
MPSRSAIACSIVCGPPPDRPTPRGSGYQARCPGGDISSRSRYCTQPGPPFRTTTSGPWPVTPTCNAASPTRINRDSMSANATNSRPLAPRSTRNLAVRTRIGGPTIRRVKHPVWDSDGRVQLVNATGSMSRRECVDLIEGDVDGPRLTMEQRQLARRLSARGLSLREVGRQVGCSHEVVRTVVRRESKRGAIRPVAAGTGTADSGRPGGDQSQAARWPVVHRDRGSVGQGHVHGVSGGRRQRRPAGVSGLAGSRAGPGPCQGAPSRTSKPIRRTICTRSGFGCHRAATFRPRSGRWRYRGRLTT